MKTTTLVLGMTMALAPVVVLGQTNPGSATTGYPQTTNAASPAMASANPNGTDLSAGGNGGTDPQVMKDKIFLRKAAEGGLAEVQLGQLAAQKASGDEVKKFGQKMVTDHTAMNKDLAPFADQMGVRIPTKMNKADQEEYDRLSGLSGADFDKAYLTAMLKDHRMDFREFRGEDMSTGDPQLKEVVAEGLKTIGEHLQMTVTLAKANGVSVARTPAPAKQ